LLRDPKRACTTVQRHQPWLELLGVDVGARFGFHHENRRISFGDEIRDVLRLFSAQLVVDLEGERSRPGAAASLLHCD
jgi:hypothetical protein